MRLLRSNSSKTTFEESLAKFKQHLRTRGYPKTAIERSLSRVKFADRPLALTQKKGPKARILAFCYYVPLSSEQPQTNTDGTMESNTKSAFAENHLF